MEVKNEALSDEGYKDLSHKYTKSQKNWRLIKQYKSNGDLKCIEVNGLRS